MLSETVDLPQLAPEAEAELGPPRLVEERRVLGHAALRGLVERERRLQCHLLRRLRAVPVAQLEADADDAREGIE